MVIINAVKLVGNVSSLEVQHATNIDRGVVVTRPRRSLGGLVDAT
jgi:hypothetical protein